MKVVEFHVLGFSDSVAVTNEIAGLSLPFKLMDELIIIMDTKWQDSSNSICWDFLSDLASMDLHENPLFGGCWGGLPERRSYQRPSYYRTNPYAATSNPTPVKSKSTPNVKPKKIVTVPVNFVDSEKFKSKKVPAMDENTAAVKIQAAFLGFCVRKSRPLNKLRVIMKTRSEAVEIRRRVNDKHVVELIRRDEKERLKITEWIMSLLLRLDEIQGVIPFVRESRKTVIRELVYLEETLDDIIPAKSRQDAATEKTEETLRSQMQDLQILKSESAPNKVVTIPVNFVDSETFKSKKAPAMDANTAAVKIQAAFLGFCVRKSRPLNKLRVVMKTKAEAAEIQRRGVIPLVRESRKAVIHELLNLEETVDDIIEAKSRQEAATEEKAEESLPSEMQDLQIQGSPEEDNSNKAEIKSFEQCSCEAGQIVSGTEKSTKVDKDAENLKRNKIESPLEADASPTIPCTEEGFKIGNLRDDNNSSKSLNLLEVDASPAIPCIEGVKIGNSRDYENCTEYLDSLKLQTIQRETADLMECEGGYKMAEKAKLIEDIGMVKEENERFKRTVSDLLKKSENQSEMIRDLILRVSQLEEQLSHNF
ncbi:BAG family molecular chaperone regulator 6-like [Cryptomeria japonica]|uniref:BAG family molecular chaperone regulator 6-like n=1 Tax=Cryptomeria japonica TaxID=3369 RepID=UPI0027DA15CA|nr:BAG family molecular chaperone regulator 6-like [Cryptomeria japonica]